MAQRDIALAELTGSAVHICHMSAATSLRAVREGKEHGARGTCEVAPHHFTLTDESLAMPVSYDTNMKMNPPLRAAADRDEMLKGIADGSVDVIATDHAPHHYDEKKMEFDLAPFGIVGLETCVSICFSRLVHTGVIKLTRLIELLSTNPARILNVAAGTLSEGAVADISILAPDLPVTVDPSNFRSKARNTPFGGWQLKGGVAATIVGGRTVYANASASGAERFQTARSA
jgi:dihydroorotase